MANIPVDETPNINLDMERFETKTPVHSDEMNKRHKQHLDNEKALAFPEFDDGGTVSGISSFPEFLDMVKSKMRIFDFYKNFKAGMQFVLHTGMIVNNAATDNSKLPVSAAVAKDLQDQVTQLYSDYVSRTKANNVQSQLEFTKSLGISGDSYTGSPIWLRSDWNANNGYRAQIGFENRGCNAITLWLDTDGRLRSTNNLNATTTLATTDDLALKSKFYQLGLPQVTLSGTDVIQLGDSIQVPAGQYLIILEAIARSTDNVATSLGVRANGGTLVQGRIPYTAGTHQNLCINSIRTLSSEATITFTAQREATNGEVVFFGGTLSLIRL